MLDTRRVLNENIFFGENAVVFVSFNSLKLFAHASLAQRQMRSREYSFLVSAENALAIKKLIVC